MNRDVKRRIAEQTVAICDAGYYVAGDGRQIVLSEDIKKAVAGTTLYSIETELPVLEAKSGAATEIEVVNETAFRAISRLAARGGHVGCLNFASARNPGGGFLSGAEAQEEALSRASALYPCLLAAPGYYERNRVNRSAIYLDLVIYSPLVPFFRSDDGVLLEKPILASVLTAPAPNAGAVAQNEPRNLPNVVPTLKRRAELVLRVAATHGVERLILGAWGCGVFRNDPAVVAEIFRDLLITPGVYANAFRQITFAVFDRSPATGTFKAFADVFAGLRQNV
jgi:uncharacterized protein (TIGR02452 family)